MIKIFVHIVLSSLFLLSSTGFTINMHFCQEELIDLAVIAPAKSCCDSGQECCCHNDSESEQSNKCSDESIEIQSSGDFNISISHFEFNNNESFDLFFAHYFSSEKLIISEVTSFVFPNIEKPPLINEVDLSQIQVFLI